MHITKGHGFNVGADFARARADLPCELASADDQPFSKRLRAVWIDIQPDASLGFLRRPTHHNGRILVHVDTRGLGYHLAQGEYPDA